MTKPSPSGEAKGPEIVNDPYVAGVLYGLEKAAAIAEEYYLELEDRLGDTHAVNIARRIRMEAKNL